MLSGGHRELEDSWRTWGEAVTGDGLTPLGDGLTPLQQLAAQQHRVCTEQQTHSHTQGRTAQTGR